MNNPDNEEIKQIITAICNYIIWSEDCAWQKEYDPIHAWLKKYRDKEE